MHKDLRGKELKEGFYLDTRSARVVYFTGQYSVKNNAITEEPEERSGVYTESITSEWVGLIKFPLRYIKDASKDIAWMQQKLSQLEQQSQSAQTQPKSTSLSRKQTTQLPSL